MLGRSLHANRQADKCAPHPVMRERDNLLHASGRVVLLGAAGPDR
jgi:hypothetical protein